MPDPVAQSVASLIVDPAVESSIKALSSYLRGD